MNTLPIDFCFVPNGPVSETVAVAALAEQLGYRCMWIPDQGFCRDPFVLASAAAAATSELEIGIGITTPLTRHPAHIARAAATVDEVSGHRLRLGLGSGNVAHVVRPMGLPAKNTVDRVRTGLQQVRTLLSGEAVRFADEPESEVRLEFQPDRVMPIYVGARGPKMLEMAGAESDGVLIESLFNGDGMSHAIQRLQQGATAESRTLDQVDVVSWQVVLATEEPHREIDFYRSWIARAIQAGPRSAMLRVGIEEQTVDQVAEAMNAGRTDEATALVTDEAVRCLMMIGRPEELTEQISGLAKQGCTAISVLSTQGFSETVQNLTKFSQEIIQA